MNPTEKLFEQQLRAYGIDAIPPASPYLADRILRAARAMDRKRDYSIMEWLNSLFADFSLPQPTYMVMVMVLLGLSLGLGNMGLPNNNTHSKQMLTDDGMAL